ncbi:MAG: energy transducer TonB [Pseudomonadota bacterium]
MAAAMLPRRFDLTYQVLLRLLAAIPLAVVATLALFALMRMLVAVNDPPAEPVVEREPFTIADYVEPYTVPDREMPEFEANVPPPGLPRRMIERTDAVSEAGLGVEVSVTVDPPVIDALEIAGPIAPGLTIRREPSYPAAELRRGVEGSCTIRYDILANGRTANITALACDSEGFARASLAAVGEWRHAVTPSLPAGAVAVRGQTTQLVFALED